MHHINITKKSKRAAIQFGIYAVFGLLVTVLTIVLIYIVQGYDIDRSTGQVVQNGLILIDSAPDGASVTINGSNEGKKTPTRLSVPSNEYTVNLALNGYRDWNRTFNLEGSEVVWLDYPIFIPKSLNTVPITTLPKLSFAEMSSNRKYMIVGQDNKKEELTLFTIDNIKNILPETVNLPDGLLTKVNGSIGTLSFVSWGPNNKHVLLLHEAKGLKEFIWVDVTKPSISLNISKQFKTSFDLVQFSKNENTLIARINGSLHIINARSREISPSIAQNVAILEKAKDNIFYYTTVNQQKEYELYELAGETSRFMLSSKERIRTIDYSEYDSAKYVAIIAGDNDTLLYRNLDSGDTTRNIPFKTFNSTSVSNIEFSERGRFIMIRSKSDVHVYDIELNKDYSYSLEDEKGAEALRWLDEHHVTYMQKNKAYIMDFDGNNRYEITVADARFPIELSAKKDRIFSIGITSATKQSVLQRSELLISE